MVKQSSPKTATDWIKEKLYGNAWGVHSPEIIKSPFDTIMHSYMKMALFHRQMAVDGQIYPTVTFNEYGEIVKIHDPQKAYQLEEIYSNMGFFFEGEKY